MRYLYIDIINQSKPQEGCDFFTWIRTEQTINLKNQLPISSESDSCLEQYNSILSTSQAKWLIHPNHTVENLGCTKHTKNCFPLAHFDPVQSLRINTPPCCRQKILFVLEVITSGLRALKIPHMLCGGGVLGWARKGKMIPYDEDLDLLVDGAYWKSPLMMQFLNQTCATYGFVYTWITGMWLLVWRTKSNTIVYSEFCLRGQAIEWRNC